MCLVLEEARNGYWLPWNQSYRQQCAALWVLEIKPRSSGGASGALCSPSNYHFFSICVFPVTSVTQYTHTPYSRSLQAESPPHMVFIVVCVCACFYVAERTQAHVWWAENSPEVSVLISVIRFVCQACGI